MLTLIFIASVPAAAAAAPRSVTYHGISVSPAIVNIELGQNETAATFEITLENHLAQAVSLSASSLDFKSLNDSGGLAFIGTSSNAAAHKYGLADYIATPSDKINLAPHASTKISVSVNNRTDLSPGGHYAAVLFKNVAPSSSGTNKVDLNQVIATLVFLKKTGGEVYSLGLARPPQISTAWFYLPDNLDLFIHNSGNTQTAPRGIISITGPGGRLYERGIINTDSSLVLPDSTRLYRNALIKTGHSWLPGKYTAAITFRPDDLKIGQTVETSFIYINIPSLILLFTAGLAAGYLWRRIYHWRKPL